MLAILVHEICHKFLWIHGYRETTDEIEYLTDACAIYVGFGKVLYEGCERVTYSFEGMQHVFRVNSLGYLSQEQIAFLYSEIFNTSVEESNFNFIIIAVIAIAAFIGLGKLLINILI